MAESDTSHVERMQDYRRQLPTDARLLYDDLVANNVVPRIAAAAALYTYKLRAGEDVSQTAIGEQYDTTQTTISRWFRWLLDHSDEIGRCDLDIDFTSGSHAPTSSYAPESPARTTEIEDEDKHWLENDLDPDPEQNYHERLSDVTAEPEPLDTDSAVVPDRFEEMPQPPQCTACGTTDVEVHDWSDGKRVDCSDCNHSQFWVTDGD